MRFSVADGEGSPRPPARGGDDGPLKRDRSYCSGAPTSASVDAANEPATSPQSEIRVVTFDLDNTLWRTKETIADANDELADHLSEAFGITERSEKRMGRLFGENPDRYAGADFAGSAENDDEGCRRRARNGNEPADAVNGDREGDSGVHIQATVNEEVGKAKKKPVYLTLLRKDAIRSLLTEENVQTATSSPMELESRVDAAFDIWVEARHRSISRNLAPNAVRTLTDLRSRLTPSPQGVCIGAVTDGNSDPNRVAELEGVFDFLIRAEDVGASKPDRRVFRAAVAAVLAKLGRDGKSVGEFFLGESSDEGVAADAYPKSDSKTDAMASAAISSWRDAEEDAVEAFSDAVGPWWVHVGDDFVKDVAAAKRMGMRTVWARELIGGSGSANPKRFGEEGRTVTDLVKDVARSDGVLKMAIGESDFLSSALHEDFSDAILDEFADLGELLGRWHAAGGRRRASEAVDSLADGDVDSGIDAAAATDGQGA